MIRAVLLAAFALAASAAGGPEQDIRHVMDEQVTAWNHGNIDEFAKTYLDSPGLLFVGHTMTRGYAQMVEHYKATYPTAEKMGQLSFSEVEVHVLDPQYANVIGRFHLERGKTAGGNADGVFTLLFQKTAHGWKIIQDHTS